MSCKEPEAGSFRRINKKCTGFDIEKASLTSALILSDYGCFVPDLTSFTAEPCEGARRYKFNRSFRSRYQPLENTGHCGQRAHPGHGRAPGIGIIEGRTAVSCAL